MPSTHLSLHYHIIFCTKDAAEALLKPGVETCMPTSAALSVTLAQLRSA